MVEIRLVKHSQEKRQLLELFRASFGYDRSAELWDWKHIQNPLATLDPEVIVAVDNGRIVGMRPFLLAELWLGNERVRAAQGSDGNVHPEHQRKGIMGRMTEFAKEYLKENGYALTYGFPGLAGLGSGLKHGIKIIAQREAIFRAINSQRLISYGLGNKVLSNGLGFLYDKFLNTRPREALQSSTSFQMEVFNQFNDELKEIDALRDESLIDLVRSESYLRWRFDQRPDRDYRYIVAKKDGTLLGYAVLSAKQQRSDLIHGYIVDYLVRDRDIACFRALINKSLDELEKWGCDIALIWALGDPTFREQLLKHLGFKSPLLFPYKRWSRKGYFEAMRINEQVASGVDIYDKNNWRVTYAYSDNM